MFVSGILIGTSKKLKQGAVVALTVLASTVVLFGYASPSYAQGAAAAPPAEETGAMVWQKGGCFNCHGNLAAGDGDPSYPAGPNLRLTMLDHDGLIETISCGRPGTPMPYNLAGAYTETQCYGIPLGEPQDVNRGAGLKAEQIAKLVDFLEKDVVGVKKITRENCGAFFDGNADAPLCQQF